MRELEKIQLVFNNFETSGFIESRCLEAFVIRELVRQIQTVSINSICERITAGHVEMEMYETADKYIGDAGALYSGSLFKRIALKHDITAIRLFFADGLCEDIFVPWDNEGRPVNSLQEVIGIKRGELDMLKIVITKGAELEQPGEVICSHIET